jgi:hypothetical protein
MHNSELDKVEFLLTHTHTPPSTRTTSNKRKNTGDHISEKNEQERHMSDNKQRETTKTEKKANKTYTPER